MPGQVKLQELLNCDLNQMTIWICRSLVSDLRKLTKSFQPCTTAIKGNGKKNSLSQRGKEYCEELHSDEDDKIQIDIEDNRTASVERREKVRHSEIG